MSVTTFNWNSFHRKFQALFVRHLFIFIPSLLSPEGISFYYNELRGRGTTKNMKTKKHTQNVVQTLTVVNDSYFALIYVDLAVSVFLFASPIFSIFFQLARQAMLFCEFNFSLCFFIFSFLFVNHLHAKCVFSNFQRENGNT